MKEFLFIYLILGGIWILWRIPNSDARGMSSIHLFLGTILNLVFWPLHIMDYLHICFVLKKRKKAENKLDNKS